MKTLLCDRKLVCTKHVRKRTLLQCDFKNFLIGEFPYDPDHSAMGEYQYILPEGSRHGWTDQVCNYTWNGTGPSWIVTEAGGRHFMECMRIEKGRPHDIYPTLQTGSIFWHDYKASCTLRRLSTNGVAGLAFCMQNSLNTMVFQMQAGGVALVHRHKENVYVIAQAEFEHDCDSYYQLEIECSGDTVRCYVNGKQLLCCTLAVQAGKIGITANCPTQFTDIIVQASDATMQEILRREAIHKEESAKLQAANPRMKLWKKFDLKNFGTSRQVRFGNGFILFAQAQKRVSRDAYPHISCLTAIDMEGNILWQCGEPSVNAAKLGKISADLPFQIYDIDGDGMDEVVCAINFELMVLDGATGKVKRSVRTPLTNRHNEDTPIIGTPPGGYAFDRLNVDAISFANLSGGARATEILVKDRYCRLFAFDANLNLLWKYHSTVNTGHFPLAVDINGDGRDEILCGYHLLSADGKKLWEYPITEDHVDEIVYIPGSDGGRFACVAGSEGFFIGDTKGNILLRDGIGHAQRISIANYDPARAGYEIAVINFWGHQGIIYMYDSHGTPLWEMENELNGNLLTPINWRGDGQDYFLTNACPVHGGLYDGQGRQVVAFPNDGHPTMCAEAVNLTGDLRDEIVVWDYNNMWIYTQDDVQDKNNYHPKKCPHYNASNYRGEFSFSRAISSAR